MSSVDLPHSSDSPMTYRPAGRLGTRDDEF
jgi:hypothetical protein